MKLIFAAILAVGSVGAAAAIRYVTIDYMVVDEPTTQSLRLVYRNREAGTLCLGLENWPTRTGYLDSRDDVYLEVDGEKYFLRTGTDYCPGCATRLRPGQTIEARLNYASFRLPEALYDRPKSLHMRSVGHICSQHGPVDGDVD